MEQRNHKVTFLTLERPLPSFRPLPDTFTLCTTVQSNSSLGPHGRNSASISSALDELKSHLPHVDLPRFPPVVRRLQEAVSGDPPCTQEAGSQRRRRGDKHTLATRDVVKEEDVLVSETTGGRKRVYKAAVKRRFLSRKHTDEEDCSHGSFEMVQVSLKRLSFVSSRCRSCESGPGFIVSHLQDHQPPHIAFGRLCASFLIPQGYPASVSPQYSEYMGWRGVQYFFGGALSVFTTKALLTSVGMKRGAGASAAAINWVVKVPFRT